jgi:CRISPR-associated endonuclease Csn1
LNYRIGLDIGVNFIGWAVINDDDNSIGDLGIRLFDAAENSKDGSSPACSRRTARLARRRRRRKNHRLERIRNLFVTSGLLTAEKCDMIFSSRPNSKNSVNPLEIRCRALYERITLDELCRALYHIAKKRGFKSNRKTPVTNDEDGKMKESINSNNLLMQEKGYKTVGEMIWKDEKFLEQKKNCPGSYICTVSREQTGNEVKQIIKYQKKFGFTVPEHPDFNLDLFAEQFLSIMLSQRNFEDGPACGPYSGNQIEKRLKCCFFEENENRCAKACYSYEKFRALTQINNLKPVDLDGTVHEVNVERILEESHKNKRLTFAQVRKILNLDDTVRFNLLTYPETGIALEEKTAFIEMRSYHEIRSVIEKGIGKKFWSKWREHDNFEEMMDDIGEVFTFYKNNDTILEQLRKRGEKYDFWFTPEQMNVLLKLNFSGFGHVSRKALMQIIPDLLLGIKYERACTNAGYNFSCKKSAGKSKLLPVIPCDDLVNPVVVRALSQTRKVLNAIIRKHGSPVSIHIKTNQGIDRSLRSRSTIDNERKRQWMENRKIHNEISDKFNFVPNSCDILKYKLYQQQRGMDLYSLAELDINRIFDPDYAEIDHILPYSRTFNDSQDNKVLVSVSCNRNKKNRTPFEWFGSDLEKWDEFEKLVSSCKFLPFEKKQNLLRKAFDSESARRIRYKNLIDTRFINRFTQDYIEDSLIFTETGKYRKVFSINESLINYLRSQWELDSHKKREDTVLHYAIDAVVAASITDDTFKKIPDILKRNEFRNATIEGVYIDPDTGIILANDYRNIQEISKFPHPRKNFPKEVVDKLFGKPEEPGNVFVSRMLKKKITGQAHEETIRSVKFLNGREKYTTVSKRLEDLKVSDLENLCCRKSDLSLYLEVKTILEKEGRITEPVYKKRKDGSPGPRIRRLKVRSCRDVTGIFVSGGLAKNADMIRVDVFHKNGRNYFVPVYVHDTVKRELPCQIKPPEKNVKSIDDTFEFKFSLFSNDLIKITDKRSNKEVFGYFIKYNTSNSNIVIKLHDCPSGKEKTLTQIGKYKNKSGKSVELEKYHVGILGDYHKVRKEVRLDFSRKVKKREKTSGLIVVNEHLWDQEFNMFTRKEQYSTSYSDKC